MMEERDSKIKRVLHMFIRLCEGKTINKAEEARRFGVDERSIQRDIDDIRAFLAERNSDSGTDAREIVYKRLERGFVMKGAESSMMSNSQILAISKILLESRAFTKKEITEILDKLVLYCVPQKNMKLVSELISNEKFHYVELHPESCIQDRLWEIGEEIKRCNLLELTYQKQIASKEVVKRTVEPVAIMFSEYYFYLIAYIVIRDDRGKYVHQYDYPAIFRLDRIQSYRELGEKFCIPYAERFEEGEFRKRVQFMFPGELIRLKFRYTGNSIDAIMNRIPTARVITSKDKEYVIEAEVYGKGILMWLLSQGSMVEVLRPQTVREEMKKILTEMLQKYEG